MTEQQMIKLAREAGWQYADGDDGYAPLWRFAALVAAHAKAEEREQCAKVCDELQKLETEDSSVLYTPAECADHIRNLKD